MHHAVAADDADTIVEFAPRAAREAAAAGSHRQALAHLEVAVAQVDLLLAGEQARLVVDYSWELYIAHRFAEAVTAGRDAVRRCERLGDPVLLGEALVALSRHVLMIGDTEGCTAGHGTTPSAACARWRRGPASRACSTRSSTPPTAGCWPAAVGPGRGPSGARLAGRAAAAPAAGHVPRGEGGRRVGVAHREPGTGPGGGRRAAAPHAVGRVGAPARAAAALPREGRAGGGAVRGVSRGLRGRAAGGLVRGAGDGYERALELGWSGEVEPTREALRVLDDLDAQAPATLVRHRLRELGLTRPPRRRSPAARANPAGLTDRQLDVLDLLGEGATNAQIAARLVLSVRTVDHHVAAILARHGARSRRDAVATARSLEAGDRR